MAESVVARLTSLTNQCLAEGIPVFLYEPLLSNNSLHSQWHDYLPYPIMVFDVISLQKKVRQLTVSGNYMEPGQFNEIRNYYYGLNENRSPDKTN